MDLSYIRTLIDHLDAADVLFEPGLSDAEMIEAEGRYGIAFPPDLRKLLQRALPVSPGFPNWRRGVPAALRHSLAAPAAGVLFEVERSRAWLRDWGVRPEAATERVARVRALLTTAPPLIPVYGPHYIPAEPSLPGNPILAVVQTDVIYAGCDLASYFTAAFGVPCPRWAATAPRPIPFWDALIA